MKKLNLKLQFDRFIEAVKEMAPIWLLEIAVVAFAAFQLYKSGELVL